MKENFIHVAFVIDESGSMSGSENDIIGGFNKMIEEQKAIENGKCAVSFFSFNDNVKERFIGKDVNDVENLSVGYFQCISRNASASLFYNSVPGSSNIYINIDEARACENDTYKYTPSGLTAMNDGIGIAIDKIGKWLCDMPEEERPSKNLIVIMTDGEENNSKEYTLSKVQEMIKHQTDVYNWTFVYMGMDITNKKAADDLGISTRSFSAKRSDTLYKNYSNISSSASQYRCCSDPLSAAVTMDCYLNEELSKDTALYEKELGIKID